MARKALQNDPAKIDRFHIQSIHRAFTIIDTLLAHSPEGLTLTQLSKEVKLHISTVYRIVQNLIHWQYVRLAETSRYQLGWKFLHIGYKLHGGTNIVQAAKRHLKELNDLTGQTVYLAILGDDRAHVMYIDKLESKGTIQLSAGIGTRNYIHSTACGKILVSEWEPEQIAGLLDATGMPAVTKHTITSPERYLGEASACADMGYAADFEENEANVICVAAPVYDFNNRIAAAVSLSGVYSAEYFHKNNGDYPGLVMETACKISRELGSTRPPRTVPEQAAPSTPRRGF